MHIKSLKIQLSIFLALFAGYLAITDSDYLILISTAVALAATVLTDSLFQYVKSRKVVVTESSLVSGHRFMVISRSGNNCNCFQIRPAMAEKSSF